MARAVKLRIYEAVKTRLTLRSVKVNARVRGEVCERADARERAAACARVEVWAGPGLHRFENTQMSGGCPIGRGLA